MIKYGGRQNNEAVSLNELKALIMQNKWFNILYQKYPQTKKMKKISKLWKKILYINI